MPHVGRQEVVLGKDLVEIVFRILVELELRAPLMLRAGEEQRDHRHVEVAHRRSDVEARARLRHLLEPLDRRELAGEDQLLESSLAVGNRRAIDHLHVPEAKPEPGLREERESHLGMKLASRHLQGGRIGQTPLPVLLAVPFIGDDRGE